MKKTTILEAIIFYIVFAFLIVIVAVGIWRDAEKIAIRDFAKSQILTAKETIRGLQTVLRSIEGDAKYLASLSEIVSKNKKFTYEQFWSLYKARSSILATLTRMDSTGTIVYTVPYTDYEDSDISYQPHIKKILSNHKPVIGGPIKTVQGFDAIIYHYPVFVNDSIFDGSVAAIVSFDSVVNQFFQPLILKNKQIVWLADGKGKILIHSKLPSGISLDSVYAIPKNNILIDFLQNFPPLSDNFLVYRDENGKRRILSFCSIWIGTDHWVLGLDSDISNALSAFLSMRTKIIIITVVALVLILFAVFLITSQITRKKQIENQNKILKIKNEHRERLDYIYRFAQSLLYPESIKDVIPQIIKAVSEILRVPIVLSWFHEQDSDILTPGPFLVDDFKLMDELRNSQIDIANIELNPKIGNIDLLKVKSHIVVPIEVLNKSNPSLAVITHTLRILHSYTHIIFLILKIRDDIFGCIAVPNSASENIDAELIETFELSISQTLYIRKILNELAATNRIHQDILNTIDKAVFLVDSYFKILSASPMFYRIYEISQEAVGKNLFQVVPFLKNLHREQAYSEVIKTRMSIETEETHILNDGRKVYTRTKIIPIIEENARVSRILTIVDDITNFRVLEEQLKHTAEELSIKNRQLEKLAITDELTQLRNYRYFTEQLPEKIRQHRREKKPLVLLTMDLDNFKDYNDTYGHQAGDKLLSEIAEIVRGFIRSDDFASRYGGDEFVLVLSDCTAEEGIETAERLCRRIADTPFADAMGSRVEHITSSIGVALLTDDVPDADELLRRADTALYVSKSRGRNRVTFYEVKIENTL